MAKQTDPQKQTVERVMHAFKEGELESGSGAKVESRKQAIAIALSEAGASNRQSPEENRRARKTAEDRVRRDGKTKRELYAEAKSKGIPGRSKMLKAELRRAVSD